MRKSNTNLKEIIKRCQDIAEKVGEFKSEIDGFNLTLEESITLIYDQEWIFDNGKSVIKYRLPADGGFQVRVSYDDNIVLDYDNQIGEHSYIPGIWEEELKKVHAH